MLCCGDGSQAAHRDCGAGKTGQRAGAGTHAGGISGQRNRLRKQQRIPQESPGACPTSALPGGARRARPLMPIWSGSACLTAKLRGRRGSLQTLVEWKGKDRAALERSPRERRTAGAAASRRGRGFGTSADDFCARISSFASRACLSRWRAIRQPCGRRGRIVRDLGAEAFSISKNRKLGLPRLGSIYFSAPDCLAGDGRKSGACCGAFERRGPQEDAADFAPDPGQLCEAWSGGSFQRTDCARGCAGGATAFEGVEEDSWRRGSLCWHWRGLALRYLPAGNRGIGEAAEEVACFAYRRCALSANSGFERR